MYKNKKILAIIPARGGSKGIKYKNLLKIHNKYLIQYLADVVKKVKIIDLSIISSDNNKINKIAKKNFLVSLFKRPKNISGDKIGDLPVLKHALLNTEKITKTKFDIILMLQITSPLRKPIHIISAIKKIVNNNYDSIWSVSKVDKKYHPLKQLQINKNKLFFYDPKGKFIIRRQQLNDTFYRNGAVYAFKRKIILGNKLLTNNSSYIIIKDKQISIDNIKDVKQVKKYLRPLN